MELFVLNQSFETVSIFDNFESSIWTERYRGYGDFELYTPVTYEVLSILHKGYYLWRSDSDCMMIIETIQIDTNVEEGNRLIVAGRSLESILERRIIWDPITISGNLQNGIETILNKNIVNPTLTKRKIDNFIFEKSADTTIDSVEVETYLDGEALYGVVYALCEIDDIGFKVVLTSDNNFKLILYRGIDRSYNQDVNMYVIFSPKYENLLNSNFIESDKILKNACLIVGEDENEKRVTATYETSENISGLERREYYSDATDISMYNENDELITSTTYNKLLMQRGQEELSEYVELASFEGQVEPRSSFIYGKDYFLGDIVQIENEYGLTSISRITEIVRSNSSEGEKILPTFSQI